MEAMAMGMTRELTAKYIGVHVATLYHWLAKGRTGRNKEYCEFYDAFLLAEAKGAAVNLMLIRKAAQKDWRAAAWLLRTRHNYSDGMTEEEPPIEPITRQSTQLLLAEIAELDKTLYGVLDPVIDVCDL